MQTISSAQANEEYAVDRGQLPDRARRCRAAGRRRSSRRRPARPGCSTSRCGSGSGSRGGSYGAALAGDKREPLGARVEPVAARQRQTPFARDDDPAPGAAARSAEAMPPAGARPGWASAKRVDPLLDDLRELIGHPPPPALARAQHLQPMPIVLPLPGVVGRTVHTEGAAGWPTRRSGAAKIKQLPAGSRTPRQLLLNCTAINCKRLADHAAGADRRGGPAAQTQGLAAASATATPLPTAATDRSHWLAELLATGPCAWDYQILLN